MNDIPPPRAWIDPWPDGDAAPHAPVAAIWVATLAGQLRRLSRTPTELAAMTGLSPTTVRSVMDGHHWPTVHTAAALATLVNATAHRPN